MDVSGQKSILHSVLGIGCVPQETVCSSIKSWQTFRQSLLQRPNSSHLASLDAYLFSHLVVSRGSLFARRVSSFNTCFVKTPLQRNLFPSFINSRITFSPSWLMVVMCFISITSSRP